MALGLPLPHGCFLRFVQNSALSGRSLISRPAVNNLTTAARP
jgi:hypothetical protein